MKKVLIVDDEQIVLDVLQKILTRLGYHTVVTDSGKMALKHFSIYDFDLVLLDVLMPEKNGFKIAKEMRKKKPDQKIIMVTGLGKDTAIEQAAFESISVDNVLSKPFSFEKVKTVVKNVLFGEEIFKNEAIKCS